MGPVRTLPVMPLAPAKPLDDAALPCVAGSGSPSCRTFPLMNIINLSYVGLADSSILIKLAWWGMVLLSGADLILCSKYGSWMEAAKISVALAAFLLGVYALEKVDGFCEAMRARVHRLAPSPTTFSAGHPSVAFGEWHAV